jgi:hypothetical protein
MTAKTTKLENVLSTIDKINNQDPNTVLINNQLKPKSLIYGHQMSACLNEHWPYSNELLQIAVRAQHIKRWHLKRSEFALGKAGYFKWRIALGIFHAQLTADIMLDHGYDNSQAQTVAAIIRKENIKSDDDSQTLEDVACLVFLQHYFETFAQKHSEEKIIRILRKTWAKMSPKAQQIALKLPLPDHLNRLVTLALSSKRIN